MIPIVPLTREYVLEVSGDPITWRTIRGVAALKNGVPWAIAGVYLNESRWTMFFHIKDRPEQFSFEEKRVLLRGFRMLMNMVAGSEIPVQAHADEDVPTSESFLLHLGFKPLFGRYYQCQPVTAPQPDKF